MIIGIGPSLFIMDAGVENNKFGERNRKHQD